MTQLSSISHLFQKTVGSISLTGADHRWVIIGIAVVVVGIVVFALDKSKAMTTLLIAYGVGAVASYIPQVMQQFDRAVAVSDRLYIKIIISALPLVALLVLKYKKGKKRMGPVA